MCTCCINTYGQLIMSAESPVWRKEMLSKIKVNLLTCYKLQPVTLSVQGDVQLLHSVVA